MSTLSHVMAELGRQCALRGRNGLHLSVKEIADLCHLLTVCEAEAVRLEAIEEAARCRRAADATLAAIGVSAPERAYVDVVALQAAVAAGKVVPMFGARPNAGRAS